MLAASVAWAQQISHFETTHVRYSDDPLPGQPSFRYRAGTRPVLISAPHGARHWREDHWKMQDGFTAALAHVLAEHTGAYALYTVRRIRPDPNYDDDCDYKRTLAQLLRDHPIRLVLDLHGARFDRAFGVALGTIEGHSCPNFEAGIIQAFVAQGFKLDAPDFLDRLALNMPDYRGGVRQRTVTRFVWEQCRVNAVQIELNAHLRVVSNHAPTSFTFTPDPVRQGRAVEALIGIVAAVAADP
ncbi:MAG: hypothetical protein KJ077_05340 [Anaerolineae bacterium]|nr:hypothetical protein [Anaerolineae bacterium]